MVRIRSNAEERLPNVADGVCGCILSGLHHAALFVSLPPAFGLPFCIKIMINIRWRH